MPLGDNYVLAATKWLFSLFPIGDWNCSSLISIFSQMMVVMILTLIPKMFLCCLQLFFLPPAFHYVYPIHKENWPDTMSSLKAATSGLSSLRSIIIRHPHNTPQGYITPVHRTSGVCLNKQPPSANSLSGPYPLWRHEFSIYYPLTTARKGPSSIVTNPL